MKISHLFFVSSVAVPGLALVLGPKGPEPRSLGTDLKSPFISRNSGAIHRALEKRSGIQYDSYLPELPAGWPNISMLKLPAHVYLWYNSRADQAKAAVGERRSRSESRDLAIRPRADVATRDDPGDVARYIFMGLKIYVVANAAVTWYGLVESCQQFTQETGNGVQCVFGAITQVIAIVTLVYQGSIWRGQLATTLNNNGWHVPGINKRDEWASIMARDLSAGLKAEVRHLGTWDGIETNQKRDSGPAVPREVFGVKGGGQDFHFTYMGRDADGKDSFKLGLGDGSFQPNNKERRQNQLTDGNFYFTTGGIDFAAQSVESPTSIEWSWVSTPDSVEFSDIYNSVNCYLGGPFDFFTFGIENAISFQVYDAYQDYTMSAGVMSPFSASQESGIRSLSIGGGIGNNSCGAF